MDDRLQTLIDAIRAGDGEQVERILNDAPELIEARTETGISLVMLAAYFGHQTLARRLVDLGAPQDLFEAAATGKSLRVSEILKADPGRVNTFAADGFTPLILAAFFGHQTVAEVLLSRGADVNLPATDEMGSRPLHSAVASRHLAIVESLLKAGADVNVRQRDGFTPLHLAAEIGQLEMARLLLQHGADPSARTETGKTPLDLAIERGNQAVVGLLQNRM